MAGIILARSNPGRFVLLVRFVMAKVFAQHAHAGEYHLDIAYSNGHWEWQVAAIRNRKLPEYTGTSKSLEAARKTAASRIGMAKADWMPIGPSFEVPDAAL
jgi:hypothetical protein